MKKIILILIVIAAVTSSCVKYEEGPCVSSGSVKKRIYGFHDLTEYSVDGVDSLSQYYDSLGLSFNFIYDEWNGYNGCIMDGRRKDGLGTSLYWGWVLSNDKKFIYIEESYGEELGVGPFGINKTPNWEILKLKKEQLKLRTQYNNKEYIIVLDR